MQTFVLLSGPVAAGKTGLADALVQRAGFKKIRTSPYLVDLASTRQLPPSRSILQMLGDELDEKTGYEWVVADVVVPTLACTLSQSRWLIDCVRKPQQVASFRRAFPAARILHVHLVASEATLKARYEYRIANDQEYLGATPYEEAILHLNEVSSRGLVSIADEILSTDQFDTEQVAAEVLSSLRKQSCTE